MPPALTRRRLRRRSSLIAHPLMMPTTCDDSRHVVMSVLRVLVLIAGSVLAAACDSKSTEPSNTAPAAVFTVECNQLECTFDNGSTDADGAIMAYAWDFGDGGTSAELNPTHSFAAPGGEFTVTLAVTDDDGAEATTARRVNVSRDNAAPLPDFAVSCVHLTCGFTDQSTDPDAGGSVASRAWDFGDGRTSTGPITYHTYTPPGGQFTVTLAITDDQGAEATAVKQVEVTQGSAPDRSGTYVRETPHGARNRHSRYVIRADGTFELRDGRGADTTVYTGRWTSSATWGGWAIDPGGVILLDFDGFAKSVCNGEGFGSFLLDGHMGVAYCGVMIQAGLEEGVYTRAPVPDTPGLPPPQAGQIAFVRDGRIHQANTDGSGLVPLSAGPDDRDPAWSPDGSRIAFSRTSGGTTGVFIMDADGSNVVRRTTSGGEPTWSPDGEWIAFTCPWAGGYADICKANADDDAATPVTITQQAARVSEPTWSPDGARIAFISDWAMFDFWFDVWVVAPDGSQLSALRSHTPLTPNPDEQHQPAWSPDGRRMAYLECPWAFHVCSSSVIGVMNADGSGAVRLAAASGYASPTWSPDGQVIAFSSANAIEWVRADGSQRGRIVRDGHSPAWRP
jgi:PKD repeat protein